MVELLQLLSYCYIWLNKELITVSSYHKFNSMIADNMDDDHGCKFSGLILNSGFSG